MILSLPPSLPSSPLSSLPSLPPSLPSLLPSLPSLPPSLPPLPPSLPPLPSSLPSLPPSPPPLPSLPSLPPFPPSLPPSQLQVSILRVLHLILPRLALLQLQTSLPSLLATLKVAMTTGLPGHVVPSKKRPLEPHQDVGGCGLSKRTGHKTDIFSFRACEHGLPGTECGRPQAKQEQAQGSF